MGEIGIHLKNEIEGPVQSPTKSRQVGLSQAGLAGPVQHVNSRSGRGELVGQLASAVRRIVVYHEDFDARVLLQDGRHHERKVDPLVIGGNDDEDPLSHGADEGSALRPHRSPAALESRLQPLYPPRAARSWADTAVRPGVRRLEEWPRP